MEGGGPEEHDLLQLGAPLYNLYHALVVLRRHGPLGVHQARVWAARHAEIDVEILEVA